MKYKKNKIKGLCHFGGLHVCNKSSYLNDKIGHSPSKMIYRPVLVLTRHIPMFYHAPRAKPYLKHNGPFDRGKPSL